MAGHKWKKGQLEKFRAAMAARKKKPAVLDHTHQAILYLRAAERLIRDKPLNSLTY